MQRTADSGARERRTVKTQTLCRAQLHESRNAVRRHRFGRGSDPFDFASIHTKRSAGKPSCLFGNEKRNQAGNLLRLTVAGDAHLLRKLWPCMAPHSLNNACFIGAFLFTHKL